MASTYLGKCKNCGSDAILVCPGCTEAPSYEPGDSINSVYCSKECQTSDWLKHETHCHALGKRKILLRTAIVQQAALLTYREVGYEMLQNGPFPDHLTTTRDYQEVALAKNRCTAAMALISSLTRKLLEGTTSTIEVLDLRIGNPLLQTKNVPDENSIFIHTLLKVRTRVSNETWLIHPTTAFPYILIPYEKYMREVFCQIWGNSPTSYDWTETKDLDENLNETEAQKLNIQQERKARLHFSSFVSTHVDKDMLDGSDHEFGQKLGSFARNLEAHMKNLPS